MTESTEESATREHRALDLFAGLGGFSAAFQDADGWDVTTVDINDEFDPDIRADVLDLRPADLPDADVVLASPPCTTFSTANQPNPHWDGDTPTSVDVREAIALVHHAVGLIQAVDPDYWYLENPVGKMRVVLGEPTGTVTYCQYGYEFRKATDLWGHHAPMQYRWCSQGSRCHQPAEHGFDSGDRSGHVRDPAERSKVPYGLSKAILDAVEEAYENPPPEQTTLQEVNHA